MNLDIPKLTLEKKCKIRKSNNLKEYIKRIAHFKRKSLLKNALPTSSVNLHNDIITRNKSKSVAKVHKSIPIISMNSSQIRKLEPSSELKLLTKEIDFNKTSEKEDTNSRRNRKAIKSYASIDKLPSIYVNNDLWSNVGYNDSK